jgi:hypothetical protein
MGLIALKLANSSAVGIYKSRPAVQHTPSVLARLAVVQFIALTPTELERLRNRWDKVLGVDRNDPEVVCGVLEKGFLLTVHGQPAYAPHGALPHLIPLLGL